MTDLNFDANTVEPDEGMDAIPAGWYNALIDESDMVPTKAGDGAYLKLRFNVVDGPYANRKVYTNLNLHNPNDQTVQIARRQLSAICHATGVLVVQQTEQLHGIPIQIKVKKTKSEEYGEGNGITGFKKLENAPPMQMPGMAPPQGVPGMVPPQGMPQQPQAWNQPVQQAPPPMQMPPQQGWNQPQQAYQQPQAAPGVPPQQYQQAPQAPAPAPVAPPQQAPPQQWAQQQVPVQPPPPEQQAPPQAAPQQPQEQHPSQAAVPAWMQNQQS